MRESGRQERAEGKAIEMWHQEKSGLIPPGALECKLLRGGCPAPTQRD